ncbi:periplasmic heavy metal sensor [uncultured Tateyamaria sp.]|uniref:periplasmic heavy metal sensor n=1 Tax=uncultured Tateyamaria sp. TaxID=455651 RepID=UPI00262337B4|nr:periplasmic heavy metal sensor [uncultured Tateyamaria sp.]
MNDSPEQRRCPVWVKVALGLSLALNLAVAGLVTGLALRAGGGPGGARAPGIGYALPYVVALPRESRRAVFDAVRENPALPDRRARRADYAAMVGALTQDPFDRGAVQAILERQQNGVAGVQRAAQSKWLDVVAAMPAETRASYAARIEEVLKRGPKRSNRGPKP